MDVKMPYCGVWGCKSDSSTDKTVSWFSFPKDQPRFKAWVHYCKHQDFTPSTYSKICGKHFTKSQYSRDQERLAELGYSRCSEWRFSCRKKKLETLSKRKERTRYLWQDIINYNLIKISSTHLLAPYFPSGFFFIAACVNREQVCRSNFN